VSKAANFRPNLGDIVTMPLPTEWGPERPSTGIPQNFVLGTPGAAPGQGGPLPPGGTPGAYVPPSGLLPGSVTPNGLVIPRTVSQTPAPGATQGWMPHVIVPDSALPPALRRSQPLIHKNNWAANRYDYRLRYEAMLWQWMAEHGGLRSCCRIPDLGAPIWNKPPFTVMPARGEELQEMFALPLASVSGGPPFNGNDTVLGKFDVPNGYDGVINRFVCSFTGGGFADFSGDIVWRLRVDNRFVKNLGNVTNTYGSFQTAFIIPGNASYRLVSGQTVYLIASIPNGSPVSAPGVVAAGVFGWTYPRR
jgi:hypothetical protein